MLQDTFVFIKLKYMFTYKYQSDPMKLQVWCPYTQKSYYFG